MKNFFNIKGKYCFEWNDLRAFIQVINVILIMKFGLSIAWFGLTIGLLGIVKDLINDRRVNSLIMHFSNVVLNTFFLLSLY